MKNRYIAYGYRIINGQYAPFEAEAKAVREIFRLYCEGCSYKAITDSMNASEFPAYAGNGWNKHHIKRILENRRYTGENGYPVILTNEQYRKARAVHNKKIAGWKHGDDSAQILWKRLVCGECGIRMLRIGGKLTAKGIVQLRCKTPDCGYGLDIAVENIHRAVTYLQNKMLNAGTNTPGISFEPSVEALRLESEINRAIARPEEPNETVRLILQGIDVRYKSVQSPPGLPIIKEYEHENRLFTPDWELFKEAVSHIAFSRTGIELKTISGQEFYMERSDMNASDGDPCEEGSHGDTG
jgi:hypothetical protein